MEPEPPTENDDDDEDIAESPVKKVVDLSRLVIISQNSLVSMPVKAVF